MRKASLLICICLTALAMCLSGCSQMQAQQTSTSTQQMSEMEGRGTNVGAPVQRRADRPMHLSIPAISVDAEIEAVGVMASGDLDTPQRRPWTNVGWYSAGPMPGEPGSAVMDGHLDRPGAFPAVFWHLRDIQVGNDIEVKMFSGKTLHFYVTQTEYYTPQHAPLEAIFGDGGGRYLNLITCAGDWMPDQHQTTERLVVFATLR
jgi:sortase (surface protein transpeptidase)